MKKKSGISCANHRGFIANIFKWENISTNNKRCNIITKFKRKYKYMQAHYETNA